MAFGAEYYQGVHRTQFDGTPRAGSNCTPASLADAIRQLSRGNRDLSGGQVRTHVKPNEETNPRLPGWSLQDAQLAATRLGFSLTLPTISHRTWDELNVWRSRGRGILVQGLSSAFPDGCSGAFEGPHCIYLPPLTHSDGRWRVGDPICKDWRWESPGVIRNYAALFAGTGRALFAYTIEVPRLAWGPDVSRSIMAVDPPGQRVLAAVKEAGHDPGSLVNMADLQRALELAGHKYGSTIDPSDVQWLLDWAERA